MRNGVKAIDFMYYVATPEFNARWNKAKKGDLICHMERAIGGPSRFDSLETMLTNLDKKESLDQVEGLGLKKKVKTKLLKNNAVELFRL